MVVFPQARSFKGDPMDVGRLARRYTKLIAAFAACPLLTLSAGCNAVPASARIIPQNTDFRTQATTSSGLDSKVTSIDEIAQETPGKPKLAFDQLDEISPLPPSLKRPEGAKLDEPPPGVVITPRPIDLPRPASTPTIPEPAKDPSVRLVGLNVDESTKPAPSVTLTPAPAPAETKPDTTPPATPTPLPPAEAKKEPAPKAEPPAAVVAKPEPAPTPESEPLVKKTPEEIWREEVQSLRAVARDRAQSPQTGGPNWNVRERLLAWLSEPDIDPDARSSDDVAQGRAVLKGLAAVLDPKATNHGSEIREAIATLESHAPLEVTDLKLVRMVRGFGDIDPLEPPVRKSGQAVVLYSELNGLAYEPAGTGYRSRVAAEVELLPESSNSPVWKHSLGTAEDACRKRRRDFYVGHRFTLPESLEAGTYRLRLTERDLVADHVATKETSITILK